MIKFQWTNHPLGIPLEVHPDGDMSGERSDPFCAVAIDFTFGKERLRNGLRIPKPLNELTNGEIEKHQEELLYWLRRRLGFEDKPFDTDIQKS